MVEAPLAKKESSGRTALSGISGISGTLKMARPVKLEEVSLNDQDRISTGYKELDRVLGSGIVAGSLVLVGGDPGIGK